MKKGLLISIALIFSVAISAQDVEGFINRQMQTYPKSRLLDIYKSCFQDYMGAEHLVSDRQRVKAYLDEELNTISLDDLMPWYYEPCGIDSSYYRVSIKIIGTIDQMKLDLPNYQEDKQFIDSVLYVGKYAISHSPDYREAYHPHYRIVERNIFEKEIKSLIDQKK